MESYIMSLCIFGLMGVFIYKGFQAQKKVLKKLREEHKD